MASPIDVVTGAFSNTGRYIAHRLLARGRELRTLTGHPERGTTLDGRITPFPYDFDRPAKLVETLRGADTLYNSYWVRFDYKGLTYEKAVENTRVLVDSAVKAKIRKIVLVSIANASADSPFRYYKGKAEIEKIVRESGLQYAILRPTVIFGPGGILINNIAWLLRKFPFFLIPDGGNYRIQPVYVEDLADLAVREAASSESRELDATGPETFTYNQLVGTIAAAIERKVPTCHVSRNMAISAARVLGLFANDIVLTPDEVDGLSSDLLYSRQPATCKTPFTKWLALNKDQVGRSYISELKVHFDKETRNG